MRLLDDNLSLVMPLKSTEVFIGGAMLHQAAGAGSGIVPHVLAQQGVGSWQPPLGGYPAPIIVPMAMGNLNQSGESK